MTDFYIKCEILGDLYQNYKEDFKDFIEFNDLGFPLAYFNAQGLALPSVDGVRYIEETWDLLLTELNVKDEGFEDLSHLLTTAEQ
jgi:hypothetical protein